MPPQPGEFVDSQGSVLGTHPGIEFFTVGQRRRLGIALGERLFVTRVEPDTRRVVLGPEEELYHDRVLVGSVSYVGGTSPPAPREVVAKIRYNGGAVPAVLEPHGADAILRFESPQRAVAPGQAAVFFDGDEVLGGGFIERPLS